MTTEQQLTLEPHRSRFARRARELDPRVLSALRIEPVVLQVADVVVTVCSVLMNDQDSRPWQERLEGTFKELDPDVDAVVNGIETFAQEETHVAVDAWVRKVRNVGYQAFARRLVGAAEYDRLQRALREDAALVALAVRRGVRAAMPFVAAFEDGLEVMTAEQLAQIQAANLIGVNFGQLMHQFDAMLGEKVWPKLPMETVPTCEDDFLGLEQFADQVRASVTTSAMAHLIRVNEPLVRKLTGARDALKYSADGVSQAASSLVELIDRVLREAAAESDVLKWIDREMPDTAELTYRTVSTGERRPTIRGSTLYFVYGGGSVARQPLGSDDGTGPSILHEVLASVVVAARKKLQRLKHADSTDPADRAQLDQLLGAVEGTLWLGLWLHQMTHPSEENQSA